LHQVGISSLLIYMMHGHTYIKFAVYVLQVDHNCLLSKRFHFTIHQQSPPSTVHT